MNESCILGVIVGDSLPRRMIAERNCFWGLFYGSVTSIDCSVSLLYEATLKKGLSSIYTLELAAKFEFQHRTLKPDNFGPPTLEKVQLSNFWRFYGWTVTFDIFESAEILYYFFEHLNVLKWKNSKLQSCRSHRGLQFTYKNLRWVNLRSYFHAELILFRPSVVTRFGFYLKQGRDKLN